MRTAQKAHVRRTSACLGGAGHKDKSAVGERVTEECGDDIRKAKSERRGEGGEVRAGGSVYPRFGTERTCRSKRGQAIGSIRRPVRMQIRTACAQTDRMRIQTVDDWKHTEEKFDERCVRMQRKRTRTLRRDGGTETPLGTEKQSPIVVTC